jgi:hypothetical protein
LYYKNLGDISPDRHLGLVGKIRERMKITYQVVLKKKSIDPIQDAIVTENVLALMGVTMPIITSFSCYLTGLGWLDLLGEVCNGTVQVYLGYLICKENIEILSGKSIDKIDKLRIVKVLKEHPGIADIGEFKAEYMGEDSVKIFAAIKYNNKEIANSMINVFENDIRSITEDAKKQEEIKKLLLRSTDLLFTHTTELIKNMERDVQKEYPNASEIDLEIANSNIKQEYQDKISLSSSSEDEDAPSKDEKQT